MEGKRGLRKVSIKKVGSLAGNSKPTRSPSCSLLGIIVAMATRTIVALPKHHDVKDLWIVDICMVSCI
jgi:hypothetical protein